MWLSMVRARAYAGIAREDFRQLVKSGEIPSSFGPRGQRKVSTEDIDAYFRARRAYAPKSFAAARS